MRLKQYIQAVTAILILRAADLYITYLYTPDLAHEWNPLISFLGISWKGFILTQICIIGLISVLMYYYFNRKPVKNIQSGLSFTDFMYVYFFGTLKPWPERLFSFPKNPERHLVFNGFIIMVITIIISTFAVVHNLLLIKQIPSYLDFVSQYHQIYFPLCFVISAVFALYCFFCIEFTRYKRDSSGKIFVQNGIGMNES